MKVLLFGFGSIGQRHSRNLLHIDHDCQLVIVDPYARPPASVSPVYYTSPDLAAQHHADADFAVIASPDQCHLQQMAMLAELRIPFYVEKPICTSAQLPGLDDIIRTVDARGLRCAVGFQYRFHKNIWEVIDAAPQKYLRFYARDSLLERYGPNVMGAMMAHPIATALWVLGEAVGVDIVTDGVRAKGCITHAGGAESFYDCDMDAGCGRISQVKFKSGGVDLPPDDGMYVRCMLAYIDWLAGSNRNDKTATLEDGRAVVEVMSKCQST